MEDSGNCPVVVSVRVPLPVFQAQRPAGFEQGVGIHNKHLVAGETNR